MTSQYPSGYGVPPEVVQMILINSQSAGISSMLSVPPTSSLQPSSTTKPFLLSDRFMQNPPETDIHYWTRLLSDVLSKITVFSPEHTNASFHTNTLILIIPWSTSEYHSRVFLPKLYVWLYCFQGKLTTYQP
ncbi:hypothetical protein BDR26DRAFT_904318 [Obelidium mucronatum]|nr:hypothetical protein BDR26DRAFT_904318 [Obelidium mucronatum]